MIRSGWHFQVWQCYLEKNHKFVDLLEIEFMPTCHLMVILLTSKCTFMILAYFLHKNLKDLLWYCPLLISICYLKERITYGAEATSKKIIYQLRFLWSSSLIFVRDLEQNFVPNLLQHLEHRAPILCVYKMADAVHGKENVLNMCSKQDLFKLLYLF